MSKRGWWIAAAGIALAVAVSSQLSLRGPAASRAPPSRAGADGEPLDRVGSVRIAVKALPRGASPDWRLEVRDATGRLHETRGSGERECVVSPLPAGGVLCALRAEGFVGGTVRLSVEERQEATAALTLLRLGRVSGTVRCEGVPVAGALVQIEVPVEGAASRIDLSPGDRAAGVNRSTESDADGRYSFDRVLPPACLLVAAGFDHPPVRVGPIEIGPGEEKTVDLVLAVGAHLSGRIVDSRGKACDGATVNVLRRTDNRRVVGWEDEARARTDADGRFVTPALPGPAMRMLKAWIVADGVQQVIQFETTPPERGTKDVGTLAPHPGTVVFEMEGPVGDPPATLTVAVNGDPPGAGQTVILSGAAFDREGRIRMAGLPIGDGFYTAVSADSRAYGNGKFRPTGGDLLVRIPALTERKEKPPPAEQLIVDVAGHTEAALLVLVTDGDCVLWREIEKGSREPVAERVGPGRYSLFLFAGDRYGVREIEQVAGRDARTSIVPDQVGRSLSVLVLDEGKPVPGATLSIRGFRKESRGAKVPWTSAGDDGRAVLRGLPQDVTGLTILAMAADHGRGYWIDIVGKEEITVDLAGED